MWHRKRSDPGGPIRAPRAAGATRLETPIFRVLQREASAPAGVAHPVYVIDAPDWVNVIPLTDRQSVVMIRQYRHGTDEVTLEIPGGMVDPEDADAAAAARRELAEETGYQAGVLHHLGTIAPNPAIQSNHCHSFLATALRPGPQRLEGSEQIEVVEVPLAEVPQLIARGEVSHALVVVAFYWQALAG
jgi:8-oxo-dGTP pyrophosphatase MutT (NUDIX family)